MKKKVLAGLLVSVFAISALAGCGGSSSASKPAETKAAETTAAADAEVITVAASAVPHAEILEQAKPILAEQGYDLQITIFNDYVQPNEVVEAGDFDANYFQHIPYLDSFSSWNIFFMRRAPIL